MAKAKRDSRGTPRPSMARKTAEAVAVAGPIIVLVVGGVFAVSYYVSALLGAGSLGLPPVVRVCGAVLAVAGVGFACWTFLYRIPACMIVCTRATFMKMLGRVPMAERSDRTELLVVVGPQKYTRNPLYLGVVLLVFGWGLYSTSAYILVAALLLVLWFRLALIPFEERELAGLFGEQYVKYSAEVPMLIPFTKRKR